MQKSKIDSVTILAPEDSAFISLVNETQAYYRSNRTATALLGLGHVIPTNVASAFAVGTGRLNFTSSAGETLSFFKIYDPTKATVRLTVNEANVTSYDLLASNGIVHLIDSVLKVSGTAVPVSSPVATPPVTSSARPVTSPPVTKSSSPVMPPVPSPPLASSPTGAPKMMMMKRLMGIWDDDDIIPSMHRKKESSTTLLLNRLQ